MPNLVQIMVKVIMNFEVEDWNRWHTAFLANSKMRAENHIKEIYVGHELENKNKVHVEFILSHFGIPIQLEIIVFTDCFMCTSRIPWTIFIL